MEYNYALDLIKDAFNKNKLLHAYLLVGNNSDLLKEFSLDVCKLFYNIVDFSHINIKLLEIEDGKYFISKEQIENLESDLSFSSIITGKRIIIINTIDKTTKSAQNTLLKFIEEPNNDDVLFLFLSLDLSSVIDTIKSRMAIINISDVKKEVLYNQLKENLNILDSQLLSNLNLTYNKALSVALEKEYIDSKILLEEYLNIKSLSDRVSFLYKNKLCDKKTFLLFLDHITSCIIYTFFDDFLEFEFYKLTKKRFINYKIDNIIELINIINYVKKMLNNYLSVKMCLSKLLFSRLDMV